MPRDVLSEMPVSEVLQPEDDKMPVNLGGAVNALTRQAYEAMKGLGALEPAGPPFPGAIIGVDWAKGPDKTAIATDTVFYHDVSGMVQEMLGAAFAFGQSMCVATLDKGVVSWSIPQDAGFWSYPEPPEPAPPKDMVREVLLRAADLIEVEGYHSGSSYRVRKINGDLVNRRAGAQILIGEKIVGRCVMGAIHDAGGYEAYSTAMMAACAVALGAVVGRGFAAADWSDAQGSGAPVVAALRQAAANLA